MAHRDAELDDEEEEPRQGPGKFRIILIVGLIVVVVFFLLPKLGMFKSPIASTLGSGSGTTQQDAAGTAAQQQKGILGIFGAQNGGGIQAPGQDSAGSGGQVRGPGNVVVVEATPVPIPQQICRGGTVMIGATVPNYFRAGKALGCSDPVFANSGVRPTNVNLVHNGDVFCCH